MPNVMLKDTSRNARVPTPNSNQTPNPQSTKQLKMPLSTPPSSSSSLPTEGELTKELQQLRSQLSKKQSFESAVASIKSLLVSTYSSASPTTRNLFYDVVSRAATVARTRYSSPPFLTAAADLLAAAEQLSVDQSQKNHLRSCLTAIRQNLPREEGENDVSNNNGVDVLSARGRGGYLFEGHLTVDPEPPQPNWLRLQNELYQFSMTTQARNSSSDAENLGSLTEDLDLSILEGLVDLLPADASRTAPPASKAVVEKLPVVKVDEDILQKVGEDAECCICKEKLGVGDEMQELPCKHLFHPPCLKPWFEERNSCPICRHELPTDDHKYESWKEREKELEEERRGAANAVRGGEFMYI